MAPSGDPVRSDDAFLRLADERGEPYAERVFVSQPDDIGRFRDEHGAVRAPRLVVYFPEAGRLDRALPVVMREVARLREDGDPVVLVVPENTRGSWIDLARPDGFRDVVRATEERVGVPVAHKISVAAFGDGAEGFGKALAFMHGRGLKRDEGYVEVRFEDDALRLAYAEEQAVLHDRLRRVGLLDASHAYDREVADLVSDPAIHLVGAYSDAFREAIKELRRTITTSRGHLEGIVLEPLSGGHALAPEKFRDVVAPGWAEGGAV